MAYIMGWHTMACGLFLYGLRAQNGYYTDKSCNKNKEFVAEYVACKGYIYRKSLLSPGLY